MRRDVRSATVAARAAPATTAATANTISATSVTLTASGYADEDERDGQQDHGSRQSPQRLLRGAGQGRLVERRNRPIVPFQPAGHGRRAPANVPDRGGED